jgi:hypothetical protein
LLASDRGHSVRLSAQGEYIPPNLRSGLSVLRPLSDKMSAIRLFSSLRLVEAQHFLLKIYAHAK